MKHDWIPLHRVGLLEFGTSIDRFIENGTATAIDTDDSTGWLTFAYDDDSIRVHVEDRRIVSVACYEDCLFNETNLIGIDFESIVKLLGYTPDGSPDVIFIDDEPQQVYEFEKLGAQVWVKDGRVTTVFCEDGN